MNAFKRNSFRQKMFKCAVMIIILLQTAGAANVTMLGGGPNDWTASNPSKLASNGSGASLTCSLDMSAEVSARPKTQPTTAIHWPQNAQPICKERLSEQQVLDEKTECAISIITILLWILEYLVEGVGQMR
ncbi:MAG: hypothetical protein ACRENG_13995 [bacterium]